MNRQRTNRGHQEQDNYSSLIMFLLLFSGFVAIIGLIYIYGDFSQRKGAQLAGFVEVRRKTPITNTPIEDASKFIEQNQSSTSEGQIPESNQELPSSEEEDNIVEQLLAQAISSQAHQAPLQEKPQEQKQEEPLIQETIETEMIAPATPKKEEKKE